MAKEASRHVYEACLACKPERDGSRLAVVQALLSPTFLHTFHFQAASRGLLSVLGLTALLTAGLGPTLTFTSAAAVTPSTLLPHRQVAVWAAARSV